MSNDVTRRDLLRRGAAATGAATVGIAGFSGTAAATLDCPRTIGNWKNHEEWPRDRIRLHRGDERLDVEAAKEILSRPPRGDKALIVARQIIAAQLNLAGLNAAEPPACTEAVSAVQGPGSAMERAISWLDCSDGTCADGWDYVSDAETHEPVRSWDVNAGFGSWDGEPLKDRLDAFNNGRICDGCGGRESGEDTGGDDRGRERDRDAGRGSGNGSARGSGGTDDGGDEKGSQGGRGNGRGRGNGGGRANGNGRGRGRGRDGKGRGNRR